MTNSRTRTLTNWWHSTHSPPRVFIFATQELIRKTQTHTNRRRPRPARHLARLNTPQFSSSFKYKRRTKRQSKRYPLRSLRCDAIQQSSRDGPTNDDDDNKCANSHGARVAIFRIRLSLPLLCVSACGAFLFQEPARLLGTIRLSATGSGSMEDCKLTESSHSQHNNDGWLEMAPP